MAVEKKRQLNPGPAGKTAERARYIRRMKQGFNNSEACRIVGVGGRPVRTRVTAARSGSRDGAGSQLRGHHDGAGAAGGDLRPVLVRRGADHHCRPAPLRGEPAVDSGGAGQGPVHGQP